MLNFLFKSAFYYTIINKYGRKIFFIIANILFIFLVQFVYDDVVKYINSVYDKEQLSTYLLYALLLKIFLLLLNIALIIYTIYRIFNAKQIKDESIEKQLKDKKHLKQENIIAKANNEKPQMADSKISTLSIEEQLRQKKELDSKADKVIQKLK